MDDALGGSLISLQKLSLCRVTCIAFACCRWLAARVIVTGNCLSKLYARPDDAGT